MNFSGSPQDIAPQAFEEIRNKFQKLQSDDPLVTVVIIAYNEEENILKTLASLAETRSKYPVQIMVVNNNSTDKTQEVIDKCGVESVFETQQGYAYARQAGIENARGKYIISGDADTIYSPHWVELMVEPFEHDPEIVCTYSLHAFYTLDNKYPLSLLLYQQAKTFGVYFRDLQRPQLNCGGASMAYRKDKAEEIGGYNVKMIRGSDGYIAFELASLGKIKMVANRKAMIYTSMRRTEMEGNLGKAFIVRARRYLRNAFRYFTPQKD